jgi:hypothetical protein
MMQVPKLSLPGARPLFTFRERDESFDYAKELAIKGR